MGNSIYQQRANDVLRKSRVYSENLRSMQFDENREEQLKVVYNEKLKKFAILNGQEIFYNNQLSSGEYEAVENEIKGVAKIYRCKNAFYRMDPNIWNLFKSYDEKYGTVTAKRYMDAMEKCSLQYKMPFKIIYQLNKKKIKFLDKDTKKVYDNMNKLKELNKSFKNKNISICYLDKGKNTKITEIDFFNEKENFDSIKKDRKDYLKKFEKSKEFNNKPMVKNKKDGLFKRLGMGILAFVAGFSVGKLSSDINSNNNDVDLNDNNVAVTDVTTTETDDLQTTVLQDDLESIKTEIENFDFSQNQDNVIDNDDNNFEEHYDDNSYDDAHDDSSKINVGDRIEIVSSDAKYYVDSEGNGYGYSFDDLKNEYKFKEIYANYITDSGVIHGVGVTENNEEIHFGWLGKDVKIQRIDDITNDKGSESYDDYNKDSSDDFEI